MIPVPPNTFFLKYNPPSGSMIPINSEMGDLPLSASSQLLNFSSGDINKGYLVSGNISNEMTDGQYELIGGYLRTFSSGASVSNSGEPYTLSTYIFKEDIPTKEGGFSMNTGASVYNVSYEDGGNIYAQEDFEGANTSLDFQLAPISGYFGNDPYVWYDDAVDAYADKYTVTRKSAKKKLKPYRTFDPRDQPGNGGVQAGDTNDGTRFGQEPGRDWQIGGVNGVIGRRGGGVARVYLSTGMRSYMRGSGRDEDSMWSQTGRYYLPIIKKEDNTIKQSEHIKIPKHNLSDLIKYGSMFEISVSDDSEERQTTNNTIFDSVFSSRIVQNPWSADTTNPLVLSYLNIAKLEGKRNNAARFYHNWGFASGSAGAFGGKTAIELIYGRSKDLNGQTTRASIHNIPIPMITDIGNDDGNPDRRTYVPEISMDMRIDKMGPTPFYGITQNPEKYSKTGMYTGSAANEVIVYGTAHGATVDLRIDNATDTVTTFGDNKTESFLRSVVITFSNYTPDDVSAAGDHTPNITLDEFLNYGLDNFYINGQTKHGIVGGVSFKTYGNIFNQTSKDVGESYPGLDSNAIFAQALPVTRKSNYDMPASSTPQQSLFRFGGMMRLCDTKYASSGKQVISSCTLTNASNVVTMTTTTGLAAGQTFTSTTAGFDANMFIKSVDSATQITVSTFFTGTTGTNKTITFDPLWVRGGISPNVSGDDYLLKVGAPSWIDSWSGGGSATNTWAGPPLWQKVSFNSFFKLRFLWDILSVTDDKVYSNTPYSELNTASTGDAGQPVQNAQGPLCRLIIETEGDGVDSDLTENQSVPFIDIPFPCAASDGVTKKTRRWSPLDTETGLLNATIAEADGAKNWPRCMTIWVNNYRYIAGGSNSWRETYVIDSSDDYFYYGDPSKNGADQEIEMYLDNITLKDFTPEIQNMTPTNIRAEPWVIKPTTVESPLYTIIGDGNVNENHRHLTSFNAVSGSNAAARNAASFNTRYPSQSLIFGWGSKSIASTVATRTSGYLLFSDFSTNNFNDLRKFNYPMWTNFVKAGFLSMASNVVTNDLNKLGHQYVGAHFVSGTTQSQYTSYATSNFCNLSGSGYSIVDDGTVGDNKMTLGAGSNSFMSTDAFTQKGFVNINVSGNAANNTAVDFSNWGKREHAGVSVKVIEAPRSRSNLNTNQIRVSDATIFNDFQNDEYIIYRAHAGDSTSVKRTGLRLATTGAVSGDVITFTESVVTSDAGTSYMTPNLLSEVYISPYRYWVTMNYPNAPKYGASNNKFPTERSYKGVMAVGETPSTSLTGTTLNESIYSYEVSQTGSTGRSGLYNSMWDFDIDEDDSVFELGQDFGFGAYDPDTMLGGEVDIIPVLSGTYVDINFTGPIQKGTITQNSQFLSMTKLDGKETDGAVSLYSPSVPDSYTTLSLKPAFYWQYVDTPPAIPVLEVKPAMDLLDPDLNLYDLTDENLNAVKYVWDEGDEDIWYRYMIMATGNIANKYHGARLWIPLNEQPPNQDTGYYRATSLKDYWTTAHIAYDVVSGTSTTLQNAGNGMGETRDVLGIVTSAFASTLTSDLTGISGWTTQFTDDSAGSYCVLPSGGNFSFPMGSAAETKKFSISVHGAMTSGTSAARQYIFSKGITYNSGASAGTGLAILISGANANAPVVQVYHAGTLLNSVTPLPNDGSAFNIILYI